jgi:hypothetical protein
MTQQPNIQQLVLDRKGGRTFTRLMEDCGGVPTDKRLNQITQHGIKNFPDAATIEGLSTGLNVSVTSVVLACARSLGLKVGVTDPDSLTITGVSKLPLSSQNLIVTLAQEMVALKGAD